MTSPPNLRRFTVTETREAMVVTADNLDEVAAWCGGEVRDPPFWPEVMYPKERDEYGIAEPGDVLVTDGTRWWDVSREEFDQDSRHWTEVRSLRGGREVREDNLERLAMWVGGEVVDQGPPVGRGLHFLASEGFHTYAWPGDVIVPEGDGHDVVPARDLIEETP